MCVSVVWQRRHAEMTGRKKKQACAADVFYLLAKRAENTLQAPISGRRGRESDSGNQRGGMTHQDDISWRHVTKTLEFICSRKTCG